jgi:hypothetical protein
VQESTDYVSDSQRGALAPQGGVLVVGGGRFDFFTFKIVTLCGHFMSLHR